MLKSLELLLIYTSLVYLTSNRSFLSKSFSSLQQELDFLQTELGLFNPFEINYENDTAEISMMYTNESDDIINTDEELFRSNSNIKLDRSSNSELIENIEFKEYENIHSPPLKYKRVLYEIHPILLKKISLSSLLNKKYVIDAINLTYNSFLNISKRIDHNDELLIDFEKMLKIKLRDVVLVLYEKFRDHSDSFGTKDLQLLDFDQVLQEIYYRIEISDHKDEVMEQLKDCIGEMIQGRSVSDMLRSYVSLYIISYYNCFLIKEMFRFDEEDNKLVRITNDCTLFFENLLYCIEYNMKNCLSNYLTIIRFFEKGLERSDLINMDEKVFYQIGVLVFNLFNQLSEIEQEN